MRKEAACLAPNLSCAVLFHVCCERVWKVTAGRSHGFLSEEHKEEDFLKVHHLTVKWPLYIALYLPCCIASKDRSLSSIAAIAYIPYESLPPLGTMLHRHSSRVQTWRHPESTGDREGMLPIPYPRMALEVALTVSAAVLPLFEPEPVVVVGFYLSFGEEAITALTI
ncbi:UNVERIFIED_CONTAM: hypothetical protein K2H54_017298 [Gekko kuhli]